MCDQPLTINKRSSNFERKINNIFLPFLSFPAFFPICLKSKACQAIFYNIKCLIRLLLSATYTWDFHRQGVLGRLGSSLRTQILAAKGTVSHLVHKRLSKISVTFKTQDGDNSESLNKLILNKIIVPCNIYRSHQP